jgi:hypothetical protein
MAATTKRKRDSSPKRKRSSVSVFNDYDKSPFGKTFNIFKTKTSGKKLSTAEEANLVSRFISNIKEYQRNENAKMTPEKVLSIIGEITRTGLSLVGVFFILQKTGLFAKGKQAFKSNNVENPSINISTG